MRTDALLAACFCTLIGVAALAAYQRAHPGLSPQAQHAAERVHRLEAEMGSVPQFHHPYSGTVPMLGRDFALPDGIWNLALLQRRTRKASPPILVAVFARHDGPLLTGLLQISGNREPASMLDPVPRSPVCSATNVIWSDARQAGAEGQDCASINSVPSILWPGAHDQSTRLLARGLALQGVRLPMKLVVASLIESDSTTSVGEVVWLNPDTLGISPDTELNPNRSAWAPDRVGQDPTKAAFLAQLRAWIEGWRPIVRAAVAGSQGPAPTAVARLP